MADDTGVLDPVDGKSATLFLVAGGLLVIFAANSGLRAFADGGSSAVHSIIGPGGFFFGIIGLFGLYPTVANRTPTAGRAVGLVTAVPGIGWFVITVFGIGNAVGVLPGMSVVFPRVFPVVVFLTTMLAYILFAVTTRRTGAHSRRVSLGLLLPVVPFLTLILGMAILGPVEWAAFAVDTGHALAHLAVGIVLRTGGMPADRTEPAAEATP